MHSPDCTVISPHNIASALDKCRRFLIRKLRIVSYEFAHCDVWVLVCFVLNTVRYRRPADFSGSGSPVAAAHLVCVRPRFLLCVLSVRSHCVPSVYFLHCVSYCFLLFHPFRLCRSVYFWPPHIAQCTVEAFEPSNQAEYIDAARSHAKETNISASCTHGVK